MPGVPATSTPPLLTGSHRIVIALVMGSPPKPPASRQSISPDAVVFEMAPAKVLHGAVRLHGLASSPTPEIQVRVACACAGATAAPTTNSAPSSKESKLALVEGIHIVSLPHSDAAYLTKNYHSFLVYCRI